jgi:hypothetical protein
LALQTLFDEGRRRDLRHAIEKGEPLPFRRKNPRAEMIMGENNGPMHSGGLNFRFDGIRPDGCAIIDITQGGESVVRGGYPMEKESRITLPDGKKITITPSKISTGNICTISVEGREGSD